MKIISIYKIIALLLGTVSYFHVSAVDFTSYGKEYDAMTSNDDIMNQQSPSFAPSTRNNEYNITSYSPFGGSGSTIEIERYNTNLDDPNLGDPNKEDGVGDDDAGLGSKEVVPTGNTPFLFMVISAAAYGIYSFRKSRIRDQVNS